MKANYIYGGYIFVSGKLQNGNPWRGLRVMLAPIDPQTGTAGWKVSIIKASYTDSLRDTLAAFPCGAPVFAYFDDEARLAHIEGAGGNSK